MERDLQLNQNFFLVDNVDHEHQKIIPKTIKKRSNKNYSPTKVKSQNLLTNISYNRLKRIDFDNPAGIYLLKVNNRNTRTRCVICSKLTIKTPERRH